MQHTALTIKPKLLGEKEKCIACKKKAKEYLVVNDHMSVGQKYFYICDNCKGKHIK
jgi:hypothetical protein